MLNRYALPSGCSRLMYSSLRPCQAWIPFSHKAGLPVAALTTRDRACVSLYSQHRRVASLKAGLGFAKSPSEPKRIQKTCFFASHARLASNSDSEANLYRLRKRRRSTNSPTRPPILLPRRQSKRTRAQSRLQARVRLHLDKPGRRWRRSSKGSGRRGGGHRFRHLNRIGKPSRSIGPYKESKRTHYISLAPWPKDTGWGSQQLTTHSLEKIEWDWVTKFPTLEIPKEMQTWTSLDTDQVVRWYGGFRFGQDSTNKKRMGLQNHDAGRLWRNVMLWCLKYRKNQALMLLLATFKGRKYRPPRYVVSDCLNFLARHLLFKVSDPNPMAVDAIWLLTRKFIEGAKDQEQHYTISQHLVYLVLQNSDDLRVLSFYWLLGLNKAVLHADTMLHFLDRFVDMGRINLSMRLLATVVDTGYDLSSDRVQMACVKLLRARFDTQVEYTVRSNILTQILEMGVRPNTPMFNAILLNAGEGGDFANAWQMYGVAKENAIIPNSITYCVLLKGAVLSGDLASLELVVREIQTNGEVLQSLHLLSDVLGAISFMSPGDQFGAMLDFYKQHCDLRPLQELSLCGSETQAPPGANRYGLWPDHYILTQMILAYVNRHQGSLGLINNYNLYYQHVKENHPLIAPLAQDDAVPNAFIIAFGKKSRTLQHCITVVKHMLELSSQRHATSGTVTYSAPTVHTWSVLVAAYFRNGQRRAAEKVIEMMHERGIQGNKVTWNTLISGYSSLQCVDAAVDTVKRMEAAGFEADTDTAKGLGRLLRRDLLVKALETNTTEPPANQAISKEILPPLDSEEQYEASTALEWESKTLNRENEVKKYLESKGQEQLGIESEYPSDSPIATA